MPVLKKAYQDFLAKFPGIKLLDRDGVDLIPSLESFDNSNNKIAVLGATMWPQAEFSLVSQINDFRRINLKANPTNPASRMVSLSPPAINELHIADREWLFGNLTATLINNPDIETIIILSHFPLTRE